MTSCESERLFSAAKLISTDLRKNLSVENLEKLLFIHQNTVRFFKHESITLSREKKFKPKKNTLQIPACGAFQPGGSGETVFCEDG
jgi:hypothetical protein